MASLLNGQFGQIKFTTALKEKVAVAKPYSLYSSPFLYLFIIFEKSHSNHYINPSTPFENSQSSQSLFKDQQHIALLFSLWLYFFFFFCWVSLITNISVLQKEKSCWVPLFLINFTVSLSIICFWLLLTLWMQGLLTLLQA
jgi:hypothetical protein